MKNKYIKFFKKELVFLLLLLIVIFVSFGLTYANFVYDSSDKRAVEMFAGALNYNIKINDTYQNNIVVPSGSSIINIEIESLNEISVYYKLLTNSNVTIYSIDGLTKGVISPNGKLNVKLYAVNNNSEEVAIPFIVSMGYLTNTLEDVIIKEDYREIDSIKNELTYDNKQWNILSINDDASINLISKDLYTVELTGYDSYNNLSDLLNSKCTTNNSRSVNINDVEGISILSDEEYTTINRLIYYPSIFKNNEGVIIENTQSNEPYNYTNSIKVKNNKIIYNKDNKIFNQGKYIVNINYYEVENNKINYYAVELDNGIVNLRRLYDSNNSKYEITSSVRCSLNIKDVAF